MARSCSSVPRRVDTYKQRINEKLGLAHRSDYVDFAPKIGLLADYLPYEIFWVFFLRKSIRMNWPSVIVFVK
ncbi:MAG: hypothetical protein NVSMB53_02370 [Gemmatimonadaceae bacterium]